MEQFTVDVANNFGFGRYFDIKPLDPQHFQIFNDRHERIGTIELDNEDHEHYRQSLDCKVDLPLLNAIHDSILLHTELAVR